MTNPIDKLNLDRKLGPLTRKRWLLLGGITLGGLYWLHRRHMADVAGPTDATTAGATQDANGAQTQTDGTATDTGTTPTSLFDPYTSGYNGYGYDLALGTGGIVGVAPVGQNGTGAGNVVPPAVPPTNPAAPGSASSSPSVVVNVPSPPSPRAKTKTVKSPSKDKRDTHHRKVRKSAHNMKNGRAPHHATQNATPIPRATKRRHHRGGSPNGYSYQ